MALHSKALNFIPDPIRTQADPVIVPFFSDLASVLSSLNHYQKEKGEWQRETKTVRDIER